MMTLSLNRLNMIIKLNQKHTCITRDTSQTLKYRKVVSKRIKKKQCKHYSEGSWNNYINFQKVNFKSKAITGNKDDPFIMIN